MRDEQIGRTETLQRRLADEELDAAVLADPDSIYYFAGFANYLGTDFGRPTLLVVPRAGAPSMVTPLMESEMCRAMSWVDDVRPWEDGRSGEWRELLDGLLAGVRRLGLEHDTLPQAVRRHLAQGLGGRETVDVARTVGEMRMIKSAAEIAVMRQAGEVAIAMAEGARAVIGEGVPEYEVALAVIQGGTRKAAELLRDEGPDRFVPPVIHNLQILQSGHDTSMVHRRASTRRLGQGEPVYLCFCGIANFRHYKLGFDREYFVGWVSDEHARIYETTLAAQAAALAAIRPGVTAEEVHYAAETAYRDAGFLPGYRTGRAIGCSFLEQPELKPGDTTRLRPGMTFAVDGGITVPGSFGARVGDSIVVTEDGCEVLTPYPKELTVL
ncbi:MAG: Xaa-Pro peptidase family protein [Alphaproteobacteria bacterium]|nr:Xaa-Pro peptidase family protein [Alphaproteobacteria bacterium]